LATQVQNINNLKPGRCPHGLPPSACPICSNMGGGGLRAGERPRKAGEMSYHECVMAGLAMRARENADKNHIKNLEQRNELLLKFQNSLNNATLKMLEFVQKCSNNVLLKPLVLTIQNIIIPITNFLKNIPVFISKLLDKLTLIKEKFVDIMDKLNAIFGEAKAFIDKNISEIISSIKNKFNNLFKIFKKNNTDDDDTKIDDDKKIFNLKTILHKIIRKKKEKHDKNSQVKQ
jgi:hypothetical protein